jgi:cellular nucleic acid-binding protein
MEAAGHGGALGETLGNSNSKNHSNSSGCRNCGQDGHFARDCPEPRKSTGCFNCGEDGHRASECTEPRKGGGGSSGGCFNCGQEGHRASECTEPRKERPMICHNCDGEGHKSIDCTAPRRPRDFSKMKCHNCQQCKFIILSIILTSHANSSQLDGHSKHKCPNPTVEDDGGFGTGSGGGNTSNDWETGTADAAINEWEKNAEGGETAAAGNSWDTGNTGGW